ncbi:MAG: 3-deoxy-D-manno-octulosonic acid transferase [Helicobacteraceae bacterium]|jgi:3-deoxy-D-manno-octulosonic-acid transferase|nr:3-deoxy-D-manno-octulosonic acid transferase [Helicobacteraceae bacterium]
MFIKTYLVLSWIIWLFALPIAGAAALFSKRARGFFFAKVAPFSPPFSRRGVWLHCASFGEVRAAEPIAAAVLTAKKPLNISVSTKTGFDEARRLYPKASVRYLPFENFISFWVTAQEALIVYEAEFWLAMFRAAQKKGAKTAIFSARIPAQKFESYLKKRFYYSRVFAFVDTIYAQSDADRARFTAIGARYVEVLGNLKLLQTSPARGLIKKPEGMIAIAASTHEGEEAMILRAWLESAIGGRILIAPRHPERFDLVFDEIQKIAEKNNLSVERIGEKAAEALQRGANPPLGGAPIALLDALGVLNDFYEIADIVVLGGAFTARGGHNPVEAARFNCKIITGEYIFHQRALFAEVSGVIFSSAENLAGSFIKALAHENARLKGEIDRAAFDRALKQIAGIELPAASGS